MNRPVLRGRPAVAALALAAGSAAAQMHQICYEGPNDGGHRTIVVGCRDDAGGRCHVTSISNAASHNPSAGYTWPAMPPHLFQVFRATAGSQPVQAKIDFHDAAGRHRATRSCTVWLGQHQQHGSPPSPGTYLEGFSTDASGLVMTGVWRAHFTGSGNDVTVPGDFIAVSGGVRTSRGAFVASSMQSKLVLHTPGSTPRPMLGTWSTRSFDDAQRIPPDTVTYAVGMKIEGVPAVDETASNDSGTVIRRGLASLLQLEQALSPGAAGGSPEAIPRATAALPPDRVAVAGEFSATAHPSNSVTRRGQYASVSAPHMSYGLLFDLLQPGLFCSTARADGWRVESKDDVGRHPGSATVGLWHLPSKIEIDGRVYEVRGTVKRATSALAPEPWAAAKGLLGRYAVTAVGGEVHWRPYNADPTVASNRLVQLRPRMDGADAEAASAHGSVLTPATLSAYAMGIQLVPAGSAPACDPRPFLSPWEEVAPSWLCSVFSGLQGWRGCEE